MPNGPSNLNAYKVMPEKLGRKLARQPDYRQAAYPPMHSDTFGSDGRCNGERLRERWNDWILT